MMDKKKILVLAGLLGLALIGALVVSFRSSRPETDGEDGEDGVTQTLGDGIAQEMADSKSDAYRGLVSTDVYFEELGRRMAEDEDVSLVSEEEIRRSGPANEGRGLANDGRGSANDGSPFGGGFAAGGSETGVAGSSVDRVFGAPPVSTESPAPVYQSSGSGSVARPMTSDERLEYDRRRAEMVRDVLVKDSSEETPGQSGSDADEQPKSIDLSALGAADDIISTLDDEMDDAAVQYEGAKRPFRCMFVRGQKLTAGQRVTLRLLEDYVEDGVRIPANTHLAAICKIGDRLELQVRSLEMNRRIIPLALDAYDTDGLQGIYCPETSASKNRQKASNEAISSAGTTFGGLVGDLASTVIRTGASIARSASGEVSVNVVSGYEFYLVKAERR